MLKLYHHINFYKIYHNMFMVFMENWIYLWGILYLMLMVRFLVRIFFIGCWNDLWGWMIMKGIYLYNFYFLVISMINYWNLFWVIIIIVIIEIIIFIYFYFELAVLYFYLTYFSFIYLYYSYIFISIFVISFLIYFYYYLYHLFA